MTYPLDLIDPAWAGRPFHHRAWVAPGEPFPDLMGEEVVAVDVETRPRRDHLGFPDAALDPWRGEVFGVAVAVPGRAWYLPLRHTSPGSERENLDPAAALQWVAWVLKCTRLVVNHNLKFDLRFLSADPAATDLELRKWGDGQPGSPAVFDTMLAAHLADEREMRGYGLKPLAEKYLNMPPDEQAKLKQFFAGQKKEFQDWSVAPVDVTAEYAVGDVERALRLAAHLVPRLRAEQVERVFAVEMAVLPKLAAAELAGVALDEAALERDQIALMLRETAAHQQLEAAMGGYSVNPNSGAELADAFTTKLGIPILVRKEPEEKEDGTLVPGAPEFDDAALKQYIKAFPQHTAAFWRIQQARRLYLIRNARVEPMLALRERGTLHYDYKQLSPRTGTRMSCERFNVTAMDTDEQWDDPLTARPRLRPDGAPALGDDGAPIIDYDAWLAPGSKQYLVARPGHTLVFADYSQIEYRIFAHYANATKIIDAYRANPLLDLHQWAAEVPLEGQLPRADAKHVHFGIVYGMGKAKTAKKMSVDPDHALRMLDRYHDEVPELEELKARVKAALLDRGYVKTLLGRRRRLEPNWQRFGFGKRKKSAKDKPRGILPYQGVNAICQGSAGDLLKERVPVADDVARAHGGRLLFLVHDEFVFELPTPNVAAFVAAVKPALETWVDEQGAPRLRVPIYVEFETSTTSWAAAQKYEVPTCAT